jgi:hypothetical protein
MVLSNNIEIGVLNIISAIILLISCILVTIYYYIRDKKDADAKLFNMNNIGLVMCVWATIILCLMGVSLINRG